MLVAIAIPVFTASLNDSKYGVDEANARSIYSEITANYLANGSKDQTVTIDGKEVKTETKVNTKSGDIAITLNGTTNTYKCNGMAEITITPGTATASPKVVIAKYDSHGEQTWGGTTVASTTK